MSLKNGFLSLLTPLAQAGTAAANTIATATVIDPTVLTAAFAVPLVGKGLEAICQKANEKWNQKSLIRTSLESLSTVLGELKEETASFPVDDRGLLDMWQELTRHAASHDEWGKLLAATDLPTSTLLCGVINEASPKKCFPVIEGALAAWLPLARILRKNPAGQPPLHWPQPESLTCSAEFRSLLADELPRRWFMRLRTEALRDDNQAIFRELSLELQHRMATRLDQLHRHAFAPPGLADLPTLERRLSGTLVELLRPQNPNGIPLVGREQELASLQDWLNAPTSISIRCLIGRGGSGKTRLAIELLRSLPKYWRAGFVEREDFESYLRQVRFRTCEWAQPTLLILDYSAAYSGWLETLIKDLRDRDQSELLPLRILLLERHASDKDGWYARLVGPTIEGAARLFHPPLPVKFLRSKTWNSVGSYSRPPWPCALNTKGVCALWCLQPGRILILISAWLRCSSAIPWFWRWPLFVPTS